MRIPFRKASLQPLLIFVLGAAAFLALRSRDFFSVDGSLRCLSIYRSPSLQFHANNHMLYPVNVLVWTRLLAAFGFKPVDPPEFVVSVEAMNCLAAAGILAILSWLILRVTGSRALGVWIPVALGLSAAFLAQATNANEPMVAVFWSVLAIRFAVSSASGNRIWPVLVSGFLLVLAMASYRSAILLWPAAAVILMGDVLTEPSGQIPTAGRWRRLAWFVAASAIAGVAIFGWAYWWQGAAPSQFAMRFLQQQDARAYLSFSGAKVLNGVLGLVRNCFFVLPEFVGMRNLLAGPKRPILLVGALCGAVVVSLIFCGYELLSSRKKLNRGQQIGALASFVGFLFSMLPVLVWDPHYGKLWLQPLICLSVLAAIALNRFIKRGGWVSAATMTAGILFLLGVAYNLSWAVHAREFKSYEFAQLSELEQLIGSQDFVVEDWNSLSLLYGLLQGNRGNSLSFIDEAVAHGAGAVSELDQNVARTRALGGRVFFVGLLDLPKPTWDSFLDRRCGVKYEQLGRYREAAHLEARWVTRSGPVLLWELDPASVLVSDSK